VALKIYDKDKMKEIQRKKSVRREIKLMERLNHPHIVKVFEAIETEDQVVLVMEYVPGGSCHGLLKSRPNRRITEPEGRKIIR
jgi:MAP/microtubule affinity-regulating kinase